MKPRRIPCETSSALPQQTTRKSARKKSARRRISIYRDTLNVFILAGGLSTRMGHDKALLDLTGETSVERLARVALKTTSRLVVVADGASKLEGQKLGDAVVLEDIVHRCGPLGGIYTGLAQAATDWNLFLTCDMPLMTAGLMRRLTRSAGSRHDAVCFLLAGEETFQPFPLLLRKDVFPLAGRLIGERRYSVMGFLKLMRVKTIALSARESQPAFLNVNTPDDLAVARKALSHSRLRTKA
jgi:molybdenum cofactor guanylyltransferase